jgi:AcrR family transcriptional regulator
MAARKSAETKSNPTRDKIMRTARELFYRDGIRAVGVDTIVAESEVAKTSLYRWFKTKDLLIAGFLEEEDQAFWVQWDKVESAQPSPEAALAAHLKWIQSYIASARFRGCPFLNAAAEFPDAEHPGRAVCRLNKSTMRRRLLRLCEGMKVAEPAVLADQLMLVIDGAFANSRVLGKSGPAGTLERAGTALIRAAPLRSSPR